MYCVDWRLVFVCFLASYICANEIEEPISETTQCDTSSILNAVLLKLISALRRELQQDGDTDDPDVSKSSTAIEVMPTETAVTETVNTTVWIWFRNERVPSIIVVTTVRSLLTPSPTFAIEELMPSTKALSLIQARRIRIRQVELEPSFSLPFDKADTRDEEGLRVSEKVMDDPRVLEAVRTLKVVLEEAYKLYSSKSVFEDKRQSSTLKP